jgi:hypothetical protein
VNTYMGLYDGGRATVLANDTREAKVKLVKRFKIPENKHGTVSITLLPKRNEIGKFQTGAKHDHR